MTLMEAAQERAAAINAAYGSTLAYTDPRKGLANLPSVIAGPPTLDYAGAAGGTLCGPAVTWQWIAVSSYLAPSFEAMSELEALIEAVDAALDVVRAVPIQFPRRDADGKTLPSLAAYLITTTDYPL